MFSNQITQMVKPKRAWYLLHMAPVQSVTYKYNNIHHGEELPRHNLCILECKTANLNHSVQHCMMGKCFTIRMQDMYSSTWQGWKQTWRRGNMCSKKLTLGRLWIFKCCRAKRLFNWCEMFYSMWIQSKIFMPPCLKSCYWELMLWVLTSWLSGQIL